MPYYLNNKILGISDKFLYEVDVYRIFPDRAECINSKFIHSNKPLKIKKEIIIKRDSISKIITFLTFISAPESYVINNAIYKEQLKRKRK